MMPTDADCAALCAAIYNTTSGTDFDHFDLGDDDGICWALKRLDGFDVVVPRGSQTELDWLRDLEAFTIPTRIGHVHAGFFEGMEHMWAGLRPLLEQPVVVIGHSWEPRMPTSWRRSWCRTGCPQSRASYSVSRGRALRRLSNNRSTA
jgi:hypothetical protein